MDIFQLCRALYTLHIVHIFLIGLNKVKYQDTDETNHVRRMHCAVADFYFLFYFLFLTEALNF